MDLCGTFIHKQLALLSLIIALTQPLTTIGQWTLIHQDSNLLEVSDLHFFNKDTGLVCGQVSHGVGFILRTEDGGASWDSITTPVLVCTYFFFLNDSIGFTGGQDGKIYQTEDAGVTWTYCCKSGGNLDVDGLHCFNDSVWLTNIYSGRVRKTTNAGNTWNDNLLTVTSNYGMGYFIQRNIEPFHFVDDSVGFAVGHGIYRTIDQANTWTRMDADTIHYLRALEMKNPSEGYAVGNRGVLLSTADAGLTWSTDTICDQDLRDITFVNDSEGYCVGGGFYYLDDTIGLVMRSTDGGTTWTGIALSHARLNAIEHIDSVIYAVGNYGHIFKYDLRTSAGNNGQELDLQHISVFPNPSEGDISIHLPDPEINEIGIYFIDSQGRVCSKQRSYSETQFFEVNTIGLANGIYSVIIKHGNTDTFRKVVIYR